MNNQKYMKKYYQEHREKLLTYSKNLNKQYYLKHKKIMRNLKINGCAICGYTKCDDALEFHHVNPKDKKFNLATRSFNRVNKNIVNEINKCILLCANCHREIHANKKGVY